jgi:hypothetical protein
MMQSAVALAATQEQKQLAEDTSQKDEIPDALTRAKARVGKP